MFYERFREQEQVQEKESDSDRDEQSLNQSSEDLNQLTNNNERRQNTGTAYDNFQKKEINNYIGKANVKEYLSPYLSKKTWIII